MQEQFRGGQKSCQNRIIGLDLVRSCAILFVIAGHFFVLNTPFKNTDFGGFSMFLQAMSIPLFMTGVPLFLLLTGYLNINKTVSAAVKQMEDIIYIRDTAGFDSLPDNLREIAELRLARPEATLKELGEALDPPVGKSGVNHRLRKLGSMAELLRQERPDTGV